MQTRLTILLFILISVLSINAKTTKGQRVFNTVATPSVRGLYVDDFKNILGNTAKENAVLAYAQAKNFNYLALYELHYFDFNNATRRTQLASFIRRAKTTYGITQVAATGEIASFFNDRILVHAYVSTTSVNTDPSVFYNYTQSRLGYIGNASTTAKPVMVIFSSESDFSVPWLNATTPARHPQDAFDLYKTNFDAETASWKANLSQVGYQWFTYSLMPEIGVVLPLQLFNFQGFTEKQGNRLVWQTTHEINVSHFDIERSFDGKIFDKLGTVQAKNANSIYEFMDIQTISKLENSQNSIQYYRLKINDLVGTSSFSKVIALNREDTVEERNPDKIGKEGKIKLFPNPTKDVLTIFCETNLEGKKIEIVNTFGQVVLTQNAFEGHSFNIQKLANGVYFLKTDNNIVRFVKY